jgi:hypothetical protein
MAYSTVEAGEIVDMLVQEELSRFFEQAAKPMMMLRQITA